VCGHRPVSLSDPVPAVIVCALSGNMWPGKKRVDQAFACEGADENSWQSRPRHAVLSPTPGRSPSRHDAAGREHDSRNVGRHLVFAASRRAEHSHSALGGCADDFVPGTRVPRSGLPRVFVRALACISMQMPGGRCICTRSCFTRAKHSWRAWHAHAQRRCRLT